MKKKNVFMEAAMLVLISLLVAFNSVQSTVIGRVTPSDAADAVMAIAVDDTTGYSMRAAITNGRFAMDLKPGYYRIIVDAREAYRDRIFENVEIKSGTTTDLGDIRIW